MTDPKTRKDDYQKALAAFGQAMKEFHKGELEKSIASLKAVIEKFPAERELADRARIYLAIAQKRPRRDTVSLKTFEDHFQYAVYKINQGNPAAALKILEKALEFKTEEGKVFYLMADASVLAKDLEPALEHLRKAVQKDKVFAILAQNEPDFEPLWEDKRFRLLMRQA